MKKILFWIVALLITLSSAFYQRMTGPTHPLRGRVSIDDSPISYRLSRNPITGKEYEFAVEVPNPDIQGYVLYRRFKTGEEWTRKPLVREDIDLVGRLPTQPPAGKLEYRVFLVSGEKEVPLPGERPVVIRFKGAVPTAILFIHIIIMFLAMLVSTRAGIEALDRKSNPRKLALWAAGLLFLGGMILGPIVQKYAFGALWTGFPFGFDLTDNKTLIAMVGWLAAVIAGRGGRSARGWVIGASVLMLVIFLIPHSLLGSELKYTEVDLERELTLLPSNQSASLFHLSLKAIVTSKTTGVGFPSRSKGSYSHCLTASIAG